MIRGHVTLLRLALTSVDAVGAVLLFVGIASARFGDQGWQQIWNAVGLHPILVACVYAAAWVFALWTQGLYGLRGFLSVRQELRDILTAMAVFALVTLSALFVLRLPDVSRLFLVLLFVTQPLLTLASRLALRVFFRWVRGRGLNARYMLIVGTGVEADEFAERIERHRELGLRVLGHLSVPDEGPSRVSRPILGTIDTIEATLHGNVVDEVAICLPVKVWNLVEPISRICEDEGKVVRVPLDLTGFAFRGGRVEEFDGQPILSLIYGPDRVLGLATKRLVDVALSAAALVVLSPVLAAVAGTILVSEGRPILFRQVRVGLHGRPFTVLKFRTMVRNAEELYPQLQALSDTRGPAFKMASDPRVTSLGRFLRRTSLDELPQLWNVLRGEMSIVGPRPAPPREVGGYSVWHRRRLSMKPGITGLWQIRGRQPDEDFDHRAGLDLDYIDRWSLWLDLKIMVSTVPALLMGRGH